jgi:hypothetical protein
MEYNRIKPQSPEDSDNREIVIDGLDKDFDGYLLLGYLKEGHEKVLVVRGNDPACCDALSFFFPTIAEWHSLGSEDEPESD